MEAADIADLLGRASTDPRIETELARFDIEERPEAKIDYTDADGAIVEITDWLLQAAAGIEFGFEDEGAFLGLDKSEYGEGPMLLTQIYLYGVRGGVRPYPGRLPFGLRYSDDRAAVRGKLAAHDTRRRSHQRDAWEFDRFTLIVAYAEGDSCIAFVLCMLRQPALPPLDLAPMPLPSPEAIVAQFGKRVDDPALRRLFVPLGLDRQRGSLQNGNVVSFRRLHGCDLVFRPSAMLAQRLQGVASASVFSEIEFFRDRALGARRWRGTLPLGIQFDDSPETVMRKLPKAPDEQAETDFSGWMLWHLRDCSLQVHHSSMDNFVVSLRILAPGIWTSLAIP